MSIHFVHIIKILKMSQCNKKTHNGTLHIHTHTMYIYMILCILCFDGIIL